MFNLDREAGVLTDDGGRRFDPVARLWVAHGAPARGEEVDAPAAVAWLQRDSGHPLRVPVAVVGPREASPQQLSAALEIGARLGRMGLVLVCGGRGGVMEAACRGAAGEGGLSIGLLPGADPAEANRFVTVPLATGIGEARNALIARCALCLVAVGDSYGTLSEVALALRFGKPVLGIADAARIAGVHQCDGIEALSDAVARIVLARPR